MLYALDGEALVTFDGDRLALTERGRPFVRAIASTFDAYLAARGARHSVAI
jgi:oxygen-independent coproporphyrinogen-3 oxidase